ncbi:MAG TPA: hypothetical protein VK327_17745 [Candidatus Paceibacterota bacterium]|nr:hypothetical protein [Candidatus Paceibacterota bacterium]
MFLQIASNVETLPVPPGRTGAFIRGILLLIFFLGLAGWIGFLLLKRSEDPARLLFKWIITLPILGALVFVVAPLVAQGGYGAAFGGIPMAAVCGLALAILWRDNLSSIVANAFGNLYDGGNTPPEPQPLYSPAIAKTKRGQYLAAIADIQQQLEKFPNDFTGAFMIAEIYAENLHDLEHADIAIQRICNQKNHPPGSIVMALNALSDWQMKYGRDRDAAGDALRKIMEMFPDSEHSAMAAQRIAHLASADQMQAAHDPRRIVVKEGLQNMGLISGALHIKAPEDDPVRQSDELVKHLETHPLDTEAREQLTVIYANHFGRLDLATEQLEQLISHPHQPAARVAHWLNLLADLQIQHGGSYETVRGTLQRLVDLFPDTAAGSLAQSRITHLKLEFRKRDKATTVTLGTYEQDIGLKQRKDG